VHVAVDFCFQENSINTQFNAKYPFSGVKTTMFIKPVKDNYNGNW